MTTDHLFQKYQKLVQQVRYDHEQYRVNTPGHDLLHALMVAQYAVMIAPDASIGELAWVAALLHNTDRLLKNDVLVEPQVTKHLLSTPLSLEEQKVVCRAVLEHAKRNSDDDDDVTMVLKDADRLANIGPSNILRIGQGFPHLPAVDPLHFAQDPSASYENLKSVYRNVAELVLWDSEGWLRLPKARELAKPYFDFLRQFMKLLERQYEEVELKPYSLSFSSVKPLN